MLDEGLDAAERFGEREQRRATAHIDRRLLAVCDAERDHAAEVTHLAPRDLMAGMGGETRPEHLADPRVLLKELGEIGDSHQRGAAFACVLYCIAPDGAVLISSGVLPGEITREAAGADGFGYDPVFRPLGDQRTLAEMTRDEKAEISHRGRAARGMARMLGIAGAGGDADVRAAAA